ncbi:MAG: dihydroorotate dehydrogenase [Candidatus Alcyoniella australis]|nr:dihydroorotate dehydrogenase [Candidatus Alcyoniella australis]
MVDLSVTVGSLKLNNPVLTASGTFGYGLEYVDLLDLSKLGGIVVKGLSRWPIPGNKPPRICETACGMLNAIGLQNIGVDAFLDEKLPRLADFDCAIIANVYGHSIEEYVEVAQLLDQRGAGRVHGIELNVSCPNVEAGGMAFGVDPDVVARLTQSVRQAVDLPLIVKLSPQVTDIAAIARAAQQAGADALSVTNTIPAMAIDAATRKPKLSNISGGLSGPAIKPVALRLVWVVSQAVSIPVIGLGGIMCGQDAAEFMIAGASAVQVGTATFNDPQAPCRIVGELEQFCEQQGIGAVRELTGTLKVDG